VPGHLDPPVTGRVTGNHGMLDCDDIVGGHPVRVRFEWRADPFSPAWRQSFSYDSGDTWKLNWERTLTRTDQADGQEGACRPARLTGWAEAPQIS
jgi:hypothetical protein